MNSMDEATEQLRTIMLDMITRQFETNPGIDSRTNLYITEVQFIKDVITILTGVDAENNDRLHDWACDLVDEIHNKFETIRRQ